MKSIKKVGVLVILPIVLMSFSQCSSSKSSQEPILQKKAPTTIIKPYFQAWVAGIQGGGSGINLFIPTQETNINLDSVYFRGMQTKLTNDKMGYVARFKTKTNQKEDVIMSNDANEEYGNQLFKETNFPFQLKDNECVISYIENNIIKYFKIQNLFEKPMAQYPSAPPRH